MIKLYLFCSCVLLGLADLGTFTAQPSFSATASANQTLLAQRRPSRRMGARGSICPIAPGLLERENVIWSDRPLFLWQAAPEVSMQQLQVLDQTGRILWEKRLNPGDESAIYDGRELIPGEFYQWKLQWRMQNFVDESDYTFQLMHAQQRNQISASLQTLTRQLQAAGATPETIANRQADYLLEQGELWSDALNILVAVNRPSPQTLQRIQAIKDACNPEVQS